MRKLAVGAVVTLITGLLIHLAPGAAAVAGDINTVAGDGTSCVPPNCGDGNLGANAQVSAPWGVVADGSGGFYISDSSANQIRYVDASRTISTVAGNGTACADPTLTPACGDGGAATAAQFNSPKGLALDAAGNLFVADTADERVRKITKAGVISTVAGNGQQCNMPFTACGDGGAATVAKISKPHAVAVDSSGALFIGGEVDPRIRRVDGKTGVISAFAGSGFCMTGDTVCGDGGTATAATFNTVQGLAVDGFGNLYLSDTFDDIVRKIDASGKITRVAGNRVTCGGGACGDGAAATAASLNHPRGVALDSAGNVFIADTEDNRVRRVDLSGTISNVAGTGTACGGGACGDGLAATAADLNQPNGLSISKAGNLLIADTNDKKVRRVDNAGPPHPGPTARLTVMPGSGRAPLMAVLDGSTTTPAANAPVVSSRLEFGDGAPDLTGTAPPSAVAHTYSTAGSYLARLTVVDYWGTSSVATFTVTVAPPSGSGGVRDFYFAEGTIRPGFLEFLTIQNPEPQAGTATLSFQASNDAGAPVAVASKVVSLPATSRVTVNLNDHVAAQGISSPLNISVHISADRGVVAERPLYFSFDPGTGPLNGGTTVVGALAPSRTFLFAEGTVRPGFKEFLTLQNPGSQPGTATLAFQASNDAGQPVSVASAVVGVPAASRVTFDLNGYLSANAIPTPINISVRVTSDVDVVAERPVYFRFSPPGLGVVTGGTDVIGAAATRRTFLFAEGTVRPGFVEFITLQNPGTQAGAATLSFQASDDGGRGVAVKAASLALPAGSRVTFNVNDYLKAQSTALPVNISLLVTSDQDIVAERPLYFLFDRYSGGTDVIGAPGPVTTALFAEGTVRGGFIEYLTLQNPGGADASATLTFQGSDDAGGAIAVPSLTVAVPALSRVTVNVNDHLVARGVPLPVNLSVSVSATQPVVAERPLYFDVTFPGIGPVNGGTDVTGF